MTETSTPMRTRRAIASLLFALALAAPTIALAEKPAAKAGSGQYVDLAAMALPVVDAGRIKNYVFVAIRLELSPKADSTRWRTKEPYFRDALIRAAHRRPFSVPGDWTRVDETALRATALAEAVKIAGPGVVTRVTILSTTPQRRTGMGGAKR
jgi:hypothetical protein